MASYDLGKKEMVAWINEHYKPHETCLDVGACDGKWFDLLGGYLEMDAIEIYTPNIIEHKLDEKYNAVFNEDIGIFEYEWYDLIIFGDVLEHMTITNAQKVLKYAKDRCRDYLIGIPFLYPQDELYGNPWERHLQDFLTPEIFNKYYPGHEILYKADNYAYYHKGVKK